MGLLQGAQGTFHVGLCHAAREASPLTSANGSLRWS
jgi:hypothetical protein